MLQENQLDPINLKRRQITMFALVATNVADGVFSALIGNIGSYAYIGIISLVASVACIVLWCRFDAAARGSKFTGSDVVWIIVLGIVGVPRYFLRTRRGWQLVFTLCGLYLYVILFVASIAGNSIANALITTFN
ncbi:hypothetical protein [Acaryochloris thomasi]|uniref:hypothetical protein n=1 Tax=Acaryochloris thomasi TaxID=2929456 RepID=UPI000DA6D05A|nr:hypothetical protein [Acaryochloris thomasi]